MMTRYALRKGSLADVAGYVGGYAFASTRRDAASHTAVVDDDNEREIARIKVRATHNQVSHLLEWAARFEKRTWAVESARGLGYLLAQQPVAAGEEVLDVPATVAARVRLLGSERSDKIDPNDAASVAVAARHAPGINAVDATNHGVVLRLLARRNNDLGRARNRIAYRLHALLAETLTWRNRQEISGREAPQALLDSIVPETAVEALATRWLSSTSRTSAGSMSRCACRRSGSPRR